MVPQCYSISKGNHFSTFSTGRHSPSSSSHKAPVSKERLFQGWVKLLTKTLSPTTFSSCSCLVISFRATLSFVCRSPERKGFFLRNWQLSFTPTRNSSSSFSPSPAWQSSACSKMKVDRSFLYLKSYLILSLRAEKFPPYKEIQREALWSSQTNII